METVVPLAAARGIPIEPVESLAEGASLEEALALVRKHTPNGAVLCTHGDVMPMLLDYYASHGVDIGPMPQWPKGCTWVLETDATGEVCGARYVPRRRADARPHRSRGSPRPGLRPLDLCVRAGNLSRDGP